MTEFDNIKTDTWEISFPKDWEDQGEREGGGFYFESSDGTKGMYITLYHLDESAHNGDLDATFDDFLKLEIENFGEMEDCHWQYSKVKTITSGSIKAATVSVYDRQRNYLIVAKLMARLPHVIRSSFHDYECPKPAESTKFFAPIAQSLRFVD